jgi:hypothetical protein
LNEKTTQRAHLMAALSAAETITANTVVVPTILRLVASPLEDGPFSLDAYFHERPESLADYAAALDLPLSVRPHGSNPGQPFAEAKGEAYGIKVRAWSLGIQGDAERYRDAVFSSGVAAGLPAEWSAAVSA